MEAQIAVKYAKCVDILLFGSVAPHHLVKEAVAVTVIPGSRTDQDKQAALNRRNLTAIMCA